jgi:hypothetical protein
MQKLPNSGTEVHQIIFRSISGEFHYFGKLIPYLHVYKPHFWQKFTLQNWDAAYARNIISFDDWARDAGILYCKTPSKDR